MIRRRTNVFGEPTPRRGHRLFGTGGSGSPGGGDPGGSGPGGGNPAATGTVEETEGGNASMTEDGKTIINE